MVDHSIGVMASLRELVDIRGYGLEVSPYYQPCLSKNEFNVVYTDYLDNADIQAKAAKNPELNGCHVPLVDFVWKPGTSLSQCMHNEQCFDYIVASHVMEHVPNPLGWLTQLLMTMEIGGRIALFLPDRRYSSDYFRSETQFGQLIEWWVEQPEEPTVGQVMDFMANSLELTHDADIDWKDPLSIGRLKRHYPSADIINTGIALYNDRPYVDVHCTVWTADSFTSVFKRVEQCGIIGAKLLHVVDDEGEFLAVLEKVSEPAFTPPDRKVVSAAQPDCVVASVEQVDFRERDLEDVSHRLDILRHDLSFLIDRTHEASSAINRIEVRQIMDSQSIEKVSRPWWRRLLG